MRGVITITPPPLGLLDELVDFVGRLGPVEFSFKYAAFNRRQPQRPAFSGRGAAWRGLQDLAVRLGLPTR